MRSHRGAHGIDAPAPQHRVGDRLHLRLRLRLPRHGIRRRHVARRVPRARGRQLAHLRRGRGHRRRARAGAAVRARERRAASRHQAGQRAHRPRRSRQAHRLRHGHALGGRRLWRGARRHHRLHAARAARQPGRRPANRPLCPRLRALRGALRDLPVPSDHAGRLARPHHQGRHLPERAHPEHPRALGSGARGRALAHAAGPPAHRRCVRRPLSRAARQRARGPQEPGAHDRGALCRRRGAGR